MSLVSIPEAHDLWLTSLAAQGRKPSTLAINSYAVKQLVEWRGNADLTSITRFEALAYTKWLGDQFQPGGVVTRLKSLRAFANWCIAEELCESNPWLRIKINVPDDPRPTADEDQIERMLTHARKHRRDYALLILLADSGARKAEVAAVQVADIDLKAGTVTFRESKSRPRTIPMSDRCCTAIGLWLRARGVGAGSLWSVGDPYSLVKQCVKRHSAGGITPHQLRRAFAVRWLTKGLSEVSLMRHCGWSSREMITLYSRASADVIAAEEYRRFMA